MTGPHPDVAAVRLAVRRCLADVRPQPIAVAFSGGADSTALLAAACFERPGQVTALIADQHWYAGSADAANAAARRARELGADGVVIDAPSERSEAAARAVRYERISGAAGDRGCAVILLGHTRDDQAETVLLGLARGSGARSLAGMSARRDPYRRPFLDLSRATTRGACLALGLTVYDDPANDDPRFARTRVRVNALPALAKALDRDVSVNLARSARLLRDDADLLDALAADASAAVIGPDGSLDAVALAGLAPALRRRVMHVWAPGSTSTQLDALDALTVRWRGQGPVSLPGGAKAIRSSGRIGQVPGPDDLPPGVVKVLISESEIKSRIKALAAEIDAAHEGHELVLVAVLKGAIMVVADLSRALKTPASIEFMAVSSYGGATSSSGVVRILKDLDRDISGRHVLIVEDIVDSGLTLSWLIRNLKARHPASLEVCTLLRKPDAEQVKVPVRYVGFDLGPEFVVGYGLDFAERFRGLPYVALFDPPRGS